MGAGCGRRTDAAQQGQALVEFALSSTVLILLLAASMDFGSLYSDRLELDNAARVGVRWAVKHPTAWTNAASPADNTIQGQIIYAGDTRNIPNLDANITIAYYVYDKTTHVFTPCGQYQANTNPIGFNGLNSYTQATCVVPGTFIKVIIVYQYPVLTPIFQNLYGGTIRISSDATMLEEV